MIKQTWLYSLLILLWQNTIQKHFKKEWFNVAHSYRECSSSWQGRPGAGAEGGWTLSTTVMKQRMNEFLCSASLFVLVFLGFQTMEWYWLHLGLIFPHQLTKLNDPYWHPKIFVSIASKSYKCDKINQHCGMASILILCREYAGHFYIILQLFYESKLFLKQTISPLNFPFHCIFYHSNKNETKKL